MLLFFFFNDTATTEIYTLSLHDALPISVDVAGPHQLGVAGQLLAGRQVHAARDLGLGHEAAAQRALVVLVLDGGARSEEHTSELQSPCNLVCRLLLEKKK